MNKDVVVRLCTPIINNWTLKFFRLQIKLNLFYAIKFPLAIYKRRFISIESRQKESKIDYKISLQ